MKTTHIFKLLEGVLQLLLSPSAFLQVLEKEKVYRMKAFVRSVLMLLPEPKQFCQSFSNDDRSTSERAKGHLLLPKESSITCYYLKNLLSPTCYLIYLILPIFSPEHYNPKKTYWRNGPPNRSKSLLSTIWKREFGTEWGGLQRRCLSLKNQKYS